MDIEKIRGFVEFYVWLLEREKDQLVQHYKREAFEAFRPENLPNDTIFSREIYEMKFREALQFHEGSYNRSIILDHQIAMMKSVLGQIDSPTNGYKLNQYYALYEMSKMDIEVPEVDYHNREYDNG